MATAEALMTAEEFGRRPDPGYPEELIQGRVVAMPPADPRHGYVCLKAGRILGNFVEDRDLGRVMSNDSAVITGRDPDSVRGADLAYYSYDKLPRGRLTKGYRTEIPELIIEVRSPSDRWPVVLDKVSEYLKAGVVVVVVLDPETEIATVCRVDETPRALASGDELTLPGVLDQFRVPVGRFFE